MCLLCSPMPMSASVLVDSKSLSGSCTDVKFSGLIVSLSVTVTIEIFSDDGASGKLCVDILKDGVSYSR